MSVVSTITNMESFAGCIKDAQPEGFLWSRRYTVQNEKYTYGQLVEKFESLLPEKVSFPNKRLARSVFTNLTKLADYPLNGGSLLNRIARIVFTILTKLVYWSENQRMASIKKKLIYTEAEVVLKNTSDKTRQAYSAMLPILFEVDPSAAANLIHSNREAKAVAMVLASGVLDVDGRGISLFERAERIYNWEKRTGLDFDKRFRLKQPETSYAPIFEQLLAAWISMFGPDANRFNREKAANKIREAYNGGQPHEDVELDLRGLQLTTIPDVVGAIPNLKRLHLDSGAMLQNPEAFQKAFHRDVVLDLIKANHTYFQYARRDLKDDEQFIMQALYRNGAVLQYLPQSDNKEFLLRAVVRAPGIMAHIPEPLRSDKEFMLSLFKAMAFGKEQWQELFGVDVGEEPPITEEILNFLTSDDPDHPGKKRVETGMFYLHPAQVDKKPFNLNTFIDLAKKKCGDSVVNYIWSDITADHGAVSPAKAQWMWLASDVIPGSGNRSYTEQQRLIAERPGLEVPDDLSATVAILTHYARTGERLFSDDPWTYTRCSNRVSGYQMAVGGFAPAGLFLSYSIDNDGIGVAGLRKFS